MANVTRAVFPLCLFPLALTAHAQQCPPGQQAYQSGRVVTASRDLVVPGTASGMLSGVVMRKGLDYQISAAGSIRVGVFGETGTPPEGWEPQGMAGQGFPSPDSYTYSLIYRVGPSGPWKFAGPGPLSIRLKAADPEQAALFFAINDNNTGNNAGSFNVNVKEIAITYQCRVPPPPPPATAAKPGGFTGATQGRQSKPTRTSSPMKLPCDGKTPDGQKQSFIFGEYCPGVTTTRSIPVEACSYAEGREEAKGLVAFGCHLAEAN